METILACLTVVSGLICGVLASMKEKASLQALQAAQRNINLMPKNAIRTVKNEDEYEQALHTLYKTVGQILALTIILALIIIYADYPTQMDSAAVMFLFGLLFQVSCLLTNCFCVVRFLNNCIMASRVALGPFGLSW